MKNYLVVLLVGLSVFCKAQNKITFDYDDAGNQIRRELCINCNKANYKTTAPKEVIALQEEDLQKFTPEDVISYYPNPVKEVLYLKWELVEDKFISSVYLYGMNGQVLRAFDALKKDNTLTIPFFSYPTGTYLVVLIYSNSEQKTIKIIKQ